MLFVERIELFEHAQGGREVLLIDPGTGLTVGGSWIKVYLFVHTIW